MMTQAMLTSSSQQRERLAEAWERLLLSRDRSEGTAGIIRTKEDRPSKGVVTRLDQ